MANYKKQNNYSYALGMSVVWELFKYRLSSVKEVYFHTKHRNSDIKDKLLTEIQKSNIPYQINDKIFNILSPKENCYVIAKFNKYETPILNNANHLVLVAPENAGNLGTIIRTSLGFGVTNIAIIGNAVDYFDPKVIRASMGAIFAVNIAHYNNFTEYHKGASQHNIYPFMLQTDNLLLYTKIAKPYSLVFGPEGGGLSLDYLKVGTAIRIPHSNSIDSLNLTNAVSIALYEVNRN